MTKYFKLFFHFLRLSWMAAMEYRVNFIIWNIVDMGWTAMDFVFFSALLSNTKQLGNWTFPESLVVIGLFRLLVVVVWGWLFASFSELPRLISQGRLDLIITKPINSQFLVSIQKFSFSIIPSIIGGITFITYGMHLLGQIPSLLQLLSFAYLVFISAILIYSMYFTTVALALYFDRLNNIHFIFTVLYDAARYPKEIYTQSFRLLFTTLVPIGIMLSVPAETLFGKGNLSLALWLHVIAIFFLGLGSFIWNRGLRRYKSASS